ncbi:hypothetical protein [Modicisalibacter xianhensis]|uniref:Uncharacterized protein n=1 Tax=Modicisalibacter xianhensis TaxID=442341 RepID=A0A1I2ZJM4_9GAMM|nr:hypothetical protein [Halomonas xianhensis]SFH38008.1 hypothetical protein SAMN04487959_103171 [Halomonas xianhensis]
MPKQSEQAAFGLPMPCEVADSHCLTIDITEYLHYPLQLQVQGWHGPQPFAWRSFSHGEPLAKGAFLEAPGIPLPGSLYRDVPHTVATVGSMALLWRYALLQACARIPAALELASDNPLLLILLVEYAQRMGWSERQLPACLAFRRSVILAAIGLPGSASLARLLRRMALMPVTSPFLTIIRECLQQPETIKLLRHPTFWHVIPRNPKLA